MTVLKRLTTQGSAEIDEEFATEERDIDPDTFDELSERVPGGYDIDFEPVQEAITTVRESDDYQQYGNKMDGAIAPVLHRQLDIPRRIAADTMMWRRLAAVELKEYVRYRWDPDKAILEKFRGHAGDLDSNAIVRLWWIAELTHVPKDSDLDDIVEVEDEYELTKKALEYRYLSNRIVDNEFHRIKPIVVAVVDQFQDAPSTLVNDMPDRINTALSLMPAEGWVDDNPVEFVKNVKARMDTE